MVSLSIEIKGSKEFQKEIDKILKEDPEKLDKTLASLAFETDSDIKRSMRASPPTGQIYKRGKNIFHASSSPGNPPRIDTGMLVGAVTVEGKKLDYTVGSRAIGFNNLVNYGVYLEFGTRLVAARPWLRPSFKRIVNRFLSKGEL